MVGALYEPRITFRHMDHSVPLEEHARKELAKLEHFLNNQQSPVQVDLVLQPHPVHAHHEVVVHVKSPRYNFSAHAEDSNIYAAITDAVDKMVNELRKAKEKRLDHLHKGEPKSEKNGEKNN
jgi:ribosomal subunit interface protein